MAIPFPRAGTTAGTLAAADATAAALLTAAAAPRPPTLPTPVPAAPVSVVGAIHHPRWDL